MCADQYNEITVAYFRRVALNSDIIGGTDVGREAISCCRRRLPSQRWAENCVTHYEKVRDAHRLRAALLREIAEGQIENALHPNQNSC